MTSTEYQRRAEEIDRLLNDPETPMRPDLVWDLVEHLARAAAEVETFAG
jgi:predicted ATPase